MTWTRHRMVTPLFSSSAAMCRGVWDQSVQRWEPGRQNTQTVSLSVKCSLSTTLTFKQAQNCRWVEENKSFDISGLYFIICAISSIASNRSMVKLMLRKVQYAPEGEGAVPSVETTRDFVMSDKPLHVKASLDKEVRRCPNTQNTTAHVKTFSSCRKERKSFQYQHPKSQNWLDQITHHTSASQMKKLIYGFCIMIMKSAALYFPFDPFDKHVTVKTAGQWEQHGYCRATADELISRNPLLCGWVQPAVRLNISVKVCFIGN